MPSKIESALGTAYPNQIMSFDVLQESPSLIKGRFVGSEGAVYQYQIDPDGVTFQESHEDSANLNDYYTARLNIEGVEYHGDSAFEYWSGRKGMSIRQDVQCKQGVPCGGRCLPKGQKCRVSSSGASGAALKGAKKGGVGLAAGVAIGAGLVGAGLAARAGVRSLNESVVSAHSGMDKKQSRKWINTANSLQGNLNKEYKKLRKAGHSHEEATNHENVKKALGEYSNHIDKIVY